MPGLLRGIARTAVIAGTATSVSNRVSRRQAGRWSRQAQEQEQEQQAQAPAPAPAAAPPPSAQDPMQTRLDQLQQLAELKKQGLLTDEELERQKAQILGS
ncbi:SHOCT domain-containing protein [Actinoplanes sp. TBRC 11911]|uniref:SHOCT domain-containing protein n=1 Tax=Actinoplanes sp. TBRC 11911 TaxID=2729386 RepID=UPI00145D536D|nr:SHOCT domain-containing protein [Actinoplanes sp. TBRC 11911]NMO52252.1 SHOCT domain-containing protein [Actinoplanes sp. TBRC 11911]